MDAIIPTLGVILVIFIAALVGDHFFFVDPTDEKKTIQRRRPENAALQIISCHACKQPIRRRADLFVVGRFRAGMLPLHRSCARAPGSIAHGFLSEGQVNGCAPFLRSLLGLNVLMLGLAALARAGLPHADLTGLVAVTVVANAWLIGYRAVVYLTLERRLP
jgi:hypothetical protein